VSLETAIALGTTAASLVSWGLAQARAVGRVEGAARQSAKDQGERIGGLEDRVAKLEAQAPAKAG